MCFRVTDVTTRNDNYVTSIPDYVWLSDETLDEAPKYTSWTSQGFWKLIGYTGEKFANDWSTLGSSIGAISDWKHADMFLYDKIKANAGYLGDNFNVTNTWDKSNLHLTWIPYGTSEKFWQSEVIVEVRYWQYRTDFIDEAEELSQLAQDKFSWDSIKLKGIEKVVQKDLLKILQARRAAIPFVDQIYADYKSSDWVAGVRKHNQKIAARGQGPKIGKSAAKIASNARQASKSKGRSATKRSHKTMADDDASSDDEEPPKKKRKTSKNNNNNKNKNKRKSKNKKNDSSSEDSSSTGDFDLRIRACFRFNNRNR